MTIENAREFIGLLKFADMGLNLFVTLQTRNGPNS
jgi:hypothetical protein